MQLSILLRIFKLITMNNKGYLFMAVAKGKESTEGNFKRYIGVAPCFIKGLNPSKAELEKIYGNTQDKEPQYVGEVEVTENGNKVKYANVRLTFITLPDEEKTGVKCDPISVSLFLLAQTEGVGEEVEQVARCLYGKADGMTAVVVCPSES